MKLYRSQPDAGKYTAYILTVFSILGIFFGESLIFFNHTIYAMMVYIINLAIIIFLIIADKNFISIFHNYKIKSVLQSIILLLLLRIINMAMPVFFISNIIWISLVYGVMFIPIYSLLKNQEMTLKEIGYYCKKPKINPLFFLLAILILGSELAWVEFSILQPEPVIDSLSIPNLIMLFIVMFFLVGTIEELIFRSILQTRFEVAFGKKTGLLLTSMLFGIMHAGYSLVYGIIFACLIGLLIGYIYQRTNCLPLIIGIHGTINVLVFGIFPFVL